MERTLTPLECAFMNEADYIEGSKKVFNSALCEFFSRHTHIEEITIVAECLKDNYKNCEEILLDRCSIRRVGCVSKTPILAIQDQQLYSDIGNLLLITSMTRGVLKDGAVTYCRLNHVP